ncbi:DUF4407 domain-containing protein, partial [Microbacterium sp. NPDC055683]
MAYSAHRPGRFDSQGRIILRDDDPEASDVGGDEPRYHERRYTPAGADDTETEPIATEPLATEPFATEPLATEPDGAAPTAPEPMGAGPAVSEQPEAARARPARG